MKQRSVGGSDQPTLTKGIYGRCALARKPGNRSRRPQNALLVQFQIKVGDFSIRGFVERVDVSLG